MSFPVHRRNLYVPIPKTASGARRPPVRPVSLAERAPCGAAFRSVPWAGVRHDTTSAPSGSQPVPSSELRVVEVFGAISWTGAPPRTKTAKQSARSVRATLESFRWE